MVSYYTRVTGRSRLISHVQNIVRWLVLSMWQCVSLDRLNTHRLPPWNLTPLSNSHTNIQHTVVQVYLESGLAAISVGPGVLPTLATLPPTPAEAAITVGLLAGCGCGRVSRVILRWEREGEDEDMRERDKWMRKVCATHIDTIDHENFSVKIIDWD